MNFDTIIKNGQIFSVHDSYTADIGIKGEKIVAIGHGPDKDAPKNAQILDARGLYVLPGGIDVHVHMELPFCGTVSSDNFETAVGMGITSFKMFMIYEMEGWMSDDASLFQALMESKEYGALITVHAESEKVMNLLIAKYLKEGTKYGPAYGHVLSRPHFIEEEAIQRAVKWAETTDGRLYIVHMSTAGGADIIKRAREQGIQAFAQTCPQYLILNDEVFKGKNGHRFATCSQIKKKEDNDRLWEGLRNGDVSVVSTDTCTFTTKQKTMWNNDFTKIPFGLPGVETMQPIIYSEGVLKKKITMNKFVEVCSTNPARLMGLYPGKGTISVGSDADLYIFNPKKEFRVSYKNLESNCDWSPFEGRKFKGFSEYTYVRGTKVVDKGRVIGKKGFGKYIKRGEAGLLP